MNNTDIKLEFQSDKRLKNDKLRHNEYYNMQGVFDSLYKGSKEGYNFTKLFNMISEDKNIMLAYRNIKRNKGSKTAGSNRRTINHWETIPVGTFIKYIKARLMDYHPQKIRRVEIPKSNGKIRPLGIPCIEDRIIQQCIKQILEPICEAKFHPSSYGFRPNRNTEHAIANLVKKINLDKKYFIVDIDIKGFFDNVDHAKLIKQLWTIGIRDKKVLCIIGTMLKAEVEGVGIPEKGVPQGGILSPLLANVVLNELDWWISDQWETFKTNHSYKQDSHKYRAMKTTCLKEFYIVRYADDFKIVCQNYDTANKIFIATKFWLKERLNLEVSPEKSKITDVRKSSSEFLGLSIKVKPKKQSYVTNTHMTEKAKRSLEDKLRLQINYVKKHPSISSVYIYNRMIAGAQNYYQIATNVYLDFKEIEYHLKKYLEQRLKAVFTNKGNKSDEYLKRYEHYGGKEYNVINTTLYPIRHIHWRIPYGFDQKISTYTEEGRNLIHSKLGFIDNGVLKYLAENPIENESIEYNDNRLSLYSAQMGKCRITGYPLTESLKIHRIIPKDTGGDDSYKNLILVNPEIYNLIQVKTLDNVYDMISSSKISLDKIKLINKYRKVIGNELIVIDK